MALIRIRVIHPAELGLDRDGYEQLVADLRGAGHQVVLEEPVERRGGIHHAAADVLIDVLGVVGEEAVGVAVGMVAESVRRRLRAREGQTKMVPIFGENGELLSQVEVDDTPKD